MRQPLSILLFNHTWFAEELRRLGHTVTTVAFRKSGFDLTVEELGCPMRDVLGRLACSIDRIVYFDDSGPVWLSDFDGVSIPSIFYSVDAHHHASWHGYLGRLFDHVLVAQRDYVETMRKAGAEAHWFPLWATVDPLEGAPRDIPVSFRGTLDKTFSPGRRAFFEEFRQWCPLDVATGPFREIYSRSRIVVNHCVADDVNFRIFEALGCGALLVTPEIENGLTALFQPGKEIVTYRRGDAGHAAERVAYYLAHEEERQAIATRGYECVRREHTGSLRAAQLEEILRELEHSPKRNSYTAIALVHFHLSLAYRKLGKPLPDPFLNMALRALVGAALHGEEASEEFIRVGVTVGIAMESQYELRTVRSFSDLLTKAYPDVELFSLLRVASLLTDGEQDLALQEASRLSRSPQEIVASAPQLIAELRKGS